jgi:hypothetical protein
MPRQIVLIKYFNPQPELSDFSRRDVRLYEVIEGGYE